MKTNKQFIKEVSEKRPDVTVLSEYKRAVVPVAVKCECGWEYSQRPDKLLRGNKACPVCGNPPNNSITNEVFAEKAGRLHKYFYVYDSVNYVNTKTKVRITCPIHGEFGMEPNAHLSGQGCPRCGKVKAAQSIGWTYQKWEEAGLKSSSFTGFKVYKVRLYNPDTEEQFIKIGKTYNTVASRMRNVPYEYEVLSVKEGSARFISELESEMHTSLKHKKYTPNTQFCGMTECYNIEEEITL